MRLPRRHPRAVYEVYDAEERLGVGGQEQSEGESAHDPGGALDGRPPAVEGIASPGALRRMLAGALLCTAAVCVLAAIAVVLMHAFSGGGTGRWLVARIPRASRTAGGELRRGALVGAARVSRRVDEPASQVEPTRPAGLGERAGRELLAMRRSVAPRRGEARLAPGSSFWPEIAISVSSHVQFPAASGQTPAGQASAVQAPSASAAADLEFGFER